MPSANDTVVLAGSTAAITDAAGDAWTITSKGQTAYNGVAQGDTAGVTEIAFVGGVMWEEDTAGQWYTMMSGNGQSVTITTGPTSSPLPAGTTTTPAASPTPTPVATPTPTPAPTPTPTASGTRDASQIPFASTSVFNLPPGSDTQWQYNGQLASANAYINTANLSGYNENIYTGTSSDPLVTITNDAGAGGQPGTFQVHIPVGAVPAPGSDATLSVDDETTGTWYSFGGFDWTGSNTATVAQGSAESDSGSGIADDDSDWDEGVGTLRESDLQAGSINHMLRIELPLDMLESVSSSANQLASYAWPQTGEDGNGPSVYTGSIPFGVTIGIPAGTAEPAAVAANAGANMLWHALQDHGAMVRDSGGSGDTVTFQADQNVNGNDPLILGMEQYSSQIIGATEILANQGPNSVNGDGTPIVALDPAPSDSGSGSETASVAAAAATTSASTGSQTVTISASEASATVSQSQVSVGATSGDHMVYISGSNNTISLSGGSDTITDTGSGNTYVLPAAGNGSNTFTSNVLSSGDTLDLTQALGATDWDGSASSVGNYVAVSDTSAGTTLSVASTSGGSGTVIATIDGAHGVTLSSLLAHAVT
jgi:hypothetical protein